ncbi:hypothetical protein GUJ93_ZPchr0006g44792 [Zizania palustris]|uniref:Uncharacterized protein n=1 Tax=Zizania palustris TaxID=103762 RepID=A0A8J5S7U4_ZIZPA|nr:hypothetical protein GUJ93_ZPchr0006g44792 [Zizania palustris]
MPTSLVPMTSAVNVQCGDPRHLPVTFHLLERHREALTHRRRRVQLVPHCTPNLGTANGLVARACTQLNQRWVRAGGVAPGSVGHLLSAVLPRSTTVRGPSSVAWRTGGASGQRRKRHLDWPGMRSN